MNNRRRVAAPALLALCVLTVGCSLGGSIGKTATPSGPRTVSPADVTYPAGLSETGVTDPDALLAAHRTVLGESDYTLRIRLGDRILRVHSSAASERMLVRDSPAGTDPANAGTMVTYREGQQVFRKLNISETTRITANRRGQSFEYFHTRLYSANVGLAIGAVEATAETAVRRGNDTYVRYSLSNEAGANGHMTVRDDGFVTELELVNSSVLRDGGPIRAEYNLTSVEIEPPSWLTRGGQSGADPGDSGPIGDADCEDFDSQAEAQRYFENHASAGDLDADDDGLACEALP